jgi:hypothetical protein
MTKCAARRRHLRRAALKNQLGCYGKVERIANTRREQRLPLEIARRLDTNVNVTNSAITNVWAYKRVHRGSEHALSLILLLTDQQRAGRQQG